MPLVCDLVYTSFWHSHHIFKMFSLNLLVHSTQCILDNLFVYIKIFFKCYKCSPFLSLVRALQFNLSLLSKSAPYSSFWPPVTRISFLLFILFLLALLYPPIYPRLFLLLSYDICTGREALTQTLNVLSSTIHWKTCAEQLFWVIP